LGGFGALSFNVAVRSLMLYSKQNALAGQNFAHKIGAHQLSAKRIAQQNPKPTHLGSQFPTLMVVFAIYVHLSRLVRICVQLSPSARV
jgi:hypothetical protein